MIALSKIYRVGGFVRDKMLGLPAHDCDFVVVGATPEEMLKNGFMPVGRDFPVFLNPKTHEEYALARTERQSGKGYHGFTFYTAPSVTIEEDLKRRDLTINAMAENLATGKKIDPFGGENDLNNKILRHVSLAFCEDPVRILRLARFWARFADFKIADETQNLCQKMIAAGEIDFLVKERVWQEFAKGLMEKTPAKMLEFWWQFGIFQHFFKGLDFSTVNPKKFSKLNDAAQQNLALNQRFAVFCGILGDETMAKKIAQQFAAPKDCAVASALLCRFKNQKISALTAENWHDFLTAFDIIRRPKRFEDYLQAAAVLKPLNVNRLRGAALAFHSAKISKIVHNTPPNEIAQKIRAVRIAALEDFFKNERIFNEKAQG